MDNLQSLKLEVFKHRPVLKEIQDQYGHLTLASYVKTAWKVPKQKSNEVFLNIIEFYLKSLYGKEMASKAKEQLSAKPLVSTIDHLGIWGHPIFVNADLIYSLHFKSSEYAICLATESVSLNNVTSWSGSVLKHDDSANLHRYSFFPDKLKTLPVFSTPAINESDILRFKKNKEIKSILNILDFTIPSASDASAEVRLSRTKEEESLNQKKLLLHQLADVDGKIGFNFSSQACQASANLWQKVFPSAPKLVYLPLESIVLEYIKNIFEDENNIITKLILTAEGRKLWQKYFSNEHTFMFWGIDEKGRRVSLKSLADDSNELIKSIESRKIYPSSPLCFMVLLLTGFACVGGFTQTTWLTEVKEKFISLLKDLEISQEVILNITNIPTKNFAESSLASLKIGENVVHPTALDLLLIGKDYYPEFVKKSETMTLSESLDKAMSEIYEVVVPVGERK